MQKIWFYYMVEFINFFFMAFGVCVKLWLSLPQEVILSMLKALYVKAFIAFLAILKVDNNIEVQWLGNDGFHCDIAT